MPDERVFTGDAQASHFDGLTAGTDDFEMVIETFFSIYKLREPKQDAP